MSLEPLGSAESKASTLYTIYHLNFVLLQVSKLSKYLQSKKLDLTIISCLVDVTLHTLDDVLQPDSRYHKFSESSS